jgi:hypothetical protein
MRDARFEEARPFGNEAEVFPEAQGALLGMDVNQSAARRFRLHVLHEGLPHPTPALGFAHGHALELPPVSGWARASGGHGHAVDTREKVLASVVYVVQLELRGDRLFLDENAAPNRAPEVAIQSRDSARNCHYHVALD